VGFQLPGSISSSAEMPYKGLWAPLGPWVWHGPKDPRGPSWLVVVLWALWAPWGSWSSGRGARGGPVGTLGALGPPRSSGRSGRPGARRGPRGSSGLVPPRARARAAMGVLRTVPNPGPLGPSSPYRASPPSPKSSPRVETMSVRSLLTRRFFERPCVSLWGGFSTRIYHTAASSPQTADSSYFQFENAFAKPPGQSWRACPGDQTVELLRPSSSGGGRPQALFGHASICSRLGRIRVS
jgi:hypothetical protein